MVAEIIMPRYDWAQTEGTIVRWLKGDKERVEKGEIVVEVESMKAVFEVEAPETGILHIVEKEGATVPIGKVIGFVAKPGEELPRREEIVPEAMEEEKAVKVEVERVEAVPRGVRISPLARRLAKEHGIDIRRVKGTGPGGRIVKEDILRAIQELGAEAVPGEVLKVAEVLPVTGMRKRIGDRLSKSYREAIHVSMTMDVDVTEMVGLRRSLLPKFEERWGVSPTYTDIIVKAVAMALKEHPILNSTLEGDKIKVYEDINIGVAVSLEEGLIVPVIRNVDKKSLAEVSLELRELAEKARRHSLSPRDYTGGTFTVTNLGMFGVHTFQPIINPPETAILGVGAIEERPTIYKGEIAARSMVTLTLVFDHRVLDGAQAAKFLKTLKGILEEPGSILEVE